jgi:hypothetical protein
MGDVKEHTDILGHYLKEKPVAPGLDMVRGVFERSIGWCVSTRMVG